MCSLRSSSSHFPSLIPRPTPFSILALAGVFCGAFVLVQVLDHVVFPGEDLVAVGALVFQWFVIVLLCELLVC